MKTLQKQSKIVKMILEYYFSNGSPNQWNIPKDMPFMNEFLNEVRRLCDLSNNNRQIEHLPILTEEIKTKLILMQYHGHTEDQWDTELSKEYP